MSRRMRAYFAGSPASPNFTSRSTPPISDRPSTSRIGISAALAMAPAQPDAEAYARALLPVVQRWCARPLEVARWLVRLLETAEPHGTDGPRCKGCGAPFQPGEPQHKRTGGVYCYACVDR